MRICRRWQFALQGRFNLAIVGGTALLLAMLMVACNLDRAGEALLNQGRFAEAIPYYELMTGVECALGTRSIRLADALTDLGRCYLKEARNSDAIKVQTIATEMRRAVLTEEAQAVLQDPSLGTAILSPSSSHWPAPHVVLVSAQK